MWAVTGISIGNIHVVNVTVMETVGQDNYVEETWS